MEMVLHAKKRTRIGDVGQGTLVRVDGLSPSAKMICIIVHATSINDVVEAHITDDFNFFELNRVAVVQLTTGDVYLIPEDEECDVITDYHFEVNCL